LLDAHRTDHHVDKDDDLRRPALLRVRHRRPRPTLALSTVRFVLSVRALYGVVGLGAGGILNFDSSTGTFSFNSVNVRVEVGFPTSSVAARSVYGNFSPSASR